MKIVKINQIKIRADENEDILHKYIIKKLDINSQDIIDLKIIKKSIDARKKPDIYYVYTVETKVKKLGKRALKDKSIQILSDNKKYSFIPTGAEKLDMPPIVCGFGPAGIFCAYMLAKSGYKPIVVERGSNVDKRTEIVEEFWKTNILSENTNVQFGEGGAGTFSDGKLNTGVNDKFMRNPLVLSTLVEFGAPKEILYDAKPHIGTDILRQVVKNMREYIISNGGKILFESKLTDILVNNNNVTGIVINGKEHINCNILVLAIGHSARDTFLMLQNKNIKMEPKPFAIGVRIEHKQSDINASLYGEDCKYDLPAASYKLTAKSKDGRGVYSFCMCPGGYVVNASSEKGMLAINGMSYSKRDGVNANSAIVTTISPNDYEDKSPLGGMYLQRELERKAYLEGDGKIPVQKYGDFKENKITDSFGNVKPNMKGEYKCANIKNILPEYVSNAIEECMPMFGKSIKGYDSDDVVMSAIESRTSSPVRIVRDDKCVSLTVNGLYPCGEGAGYAGGITSAAIDGVKVYEAIASKYSKL